MRIPSAWKRWLPAVDAFWRRRRHRLGWEARWSDPNFTAPWMNRGVSPEIQSAVADGWFPAGSAALDIGCGDGEVAGWLAGCGFPTVGVDLSRSAINRSRSRFPEARGRLEFIVRDICLQAPPDRQYRVLIDRGCFHQLPPDEWEAFRKHLLAVSAHDVRMLLFMRAYREGQTMGDGDECRRTTRAVEAGLADGFYIVREADTYLDAHGGRQPDQALGGRVFWLQRR